LYVTQVLSQLSYRTIFTNFLFQHESFYDNLHITKHIYPIHS
jgi:hypothetical protein